MQTTTGQKVFSIPALLLLSVVTSTRLSVEKMSTPRASVSTLHTSCGTPQSCYANPKTAETLMIASWYGNKFQGRQTASGERFDLNKLTAANRTLPLGTLVRITAPSTGRSIVVRINDRGPWLKGRDFDLSEAAAIKLGIHEKGIAAVKVSLFK